MTGADWSDENALAIALYLDGSDDPDRAEDGTWLLDDDFLVLVNAWWQPLDFAIPATGDGTTWQSIDTYDPARPATAAPLRAGGLQTVSPRSITVLRSPQAVAERAVELAVSALDLNALLDRVDLNALLDRIDLNRQLARVDVEAVVDRVDVEAVVDRVDVNAVVDGVDVNAVVDRVDVEAVVDRVDVEAVVDRVDVNAVVERVDIDELVEQTDLGAVIAASSSGVASDVLDVVRSQTVGLDEFIARWIGRLRRRPYTGPPGPAGGLPAKAGS